MASLTNPPQAPPVSSTWLDLAQPHRFLNDNEASLAIRLSVAGWDFLTEQAGRLVVLAKNANRAILFSYGSDGTPILVRSSVVVKVAEQTHCRSGAQSEEFLVQRAFLSTHDVQGQPRSCCLIKAPIPLTNGKSAWHHLVALAQFYPMIRKLQCHGLVVSHYCFDRLLFSSLERKVRQRHQLFHEKQGGDGAVRAGQLALDELLDWVIATPCACHDCHNALKWALQPYISEKRS